MISYQEINVFKIGQNFSIKLNITIEASNLTSHEENLMFTIKYDVKKERVVNYCTLYHYIINGINE